MRRELVEKLNALRDDTESPVAAVRHEATLSLIAVGHYLAYSDAKHAARLALSGAHARNTAGCCDGRGQVHHGEGALSFVTLCHDRECVARRERAWAIECGEVDE